MTGAELREARRAKRIKLVTLARYAGVHSPDLCNFEKGRRPLNPRHVLKAVEGLSVIPLLRHSELADLNARKARSSK